MNAGRELDLLIASTVMGWTLPDNTGWGINPAGLRQIVPRFSTSIDDAWQVVERFQGMDTEEWLRFCTALDAATTLYIQTGAAAAYTICRAALTAIADVDEGAS